MNPDLELALELADAADAITLRHFGSVDLVVESKPDMTPVTEADRAVEKMVGERLAVARPARSSPHASPRIHPAGWR